ncbi:GLPGLI family protein [Flavobacterium tructae]|uniref:GLPGLI family protein n=1 Tax=Flavobacterium tructae TaxID=1114873 RepID=UPI0035A935F5
MKKLLYLSILFSNSIIAQVNTIIEYTFQDKNNYICSSNLYIVNNEAIFKLNDDRENGIYENKLEKSEYKVNNDKISKLLFSTEKNTITRIPLYNDEIIYKTENNEIKYDLTGNTKKIDNYNCQEARLSLNGRKYTIWFTTDIPISFGPYKINGLPGLAMEITEETNNFKIQFKSLKKLTDTTDFNNFKKYILSKPALEYNKYEETIINLMTSKKIKQIATANESGVTIQYAKGQVSFTTFLIDIPTNLVSKLENITQ